MIECKITNETTHLEVEIYLSEDTLDFLFSKKSKRIEYPKKYIEYLKESVPNTFAIVSSFLNIKVEELIDKTLQTMLYEDPAADFIRTDLSKENFLTALNEYTSIVEAPNLPKNEFSPDIMLYVIALYLYHNCGGNETTFEVPEKVVPLIVNILNVMPEVPPEDFDPSKPYYVDVEKQEKEILSQFPFLKK